MKSEYTLEEIRKFAEECYLKGNIKNIFYREDSYKWGIYDIQIEKERNTFFLRIPKLSISTFADKIDEALLKMVDQAINYYESYSDGYDSESDKILSLLKNLFSWLMKFKSIYNPTDYTYRRDTLTDNFRPKLSYA